MGVELRVSMPGQPELMLAVGGNVTGCPTVEKLMTGDGPISVSYPFMQYEDALPGRHAHVSLLEDGVEIQTGRVVTFDPPDTGACDGPCSLGIRGYNEALTDRKFATAVTYGPGWDGTSLAYTPEDAVEHAVTQGGMLIDPHNPIITTGWELVDTEHFLGRPAADVVRAMAVYGAGSATPFVWSVRRGLLRWGPLNLSPQYQTTLGPGVVYKPHDDASRFYNRVLVVWGQDQAVSYPDTLSYANIPGIVDLVVNVTGEVKDLLTAQRLAESLYGRLQTLELGWSGTLTISGSGVVNGLTGAPVSWLQVQAQSFITMTGLDGAARYGRPVPETQLITHATWNGTNLVCELGEMRGPADLDKFVWHTMFQGGSRSVHAIADPSLSLPKRDADKVPLLGPAHVESTGTDSAGRKKPQPIDNWIPALSTEHKQTLITHESPKPIKIIEKAFTDDGAVFTAGLLDTGIYSDDCPPCEIDNVIMTCSPLGSITVQVWTVKQEASSDGRGRFIQDATTRHFVPDALVLTATIAADRVYQHRFTGASGDAKPRITTDAMLVYIVTGTPIAVTAFRLSVSGNRIALGHPAGHDTAPALGQRSV